MIVAGIDPSLTNAGITVLVNSTPLLLRSVGYPGRSAASYAERGDRIVAQARYVITTIADQIGQHTISTGRPAALRDIDLVVIEGPAYGQHLPSNHDRAGLWWGIYTALRAAKIPTAVVPPATRAKWATGSGRADKRAVLTFVRQCWPAADILNHDIADAAVLALIGAYRLGDPMPFTPKDRHTTGLDAVAWPDGTATSAVEIPHEMSHPE